MKESPNDLSPPTPGLTVGAASLAFDVAALRDELKARGFYQRKLGAILLPWLLHLSLTAAGMVATYHFGWSLLGALSLLVASIGTVGLGTLGHTGSHNAASESPFWNRALFYFNYPFMLGLSARYWHHSHIQLHHPAPNIVGIDEDCDLRPVFALNQEHQSGEGALSPFYYRYQWLWFPPVLLLNGMNILRQGWTRLIHELRDPALRGRDRGAWLDLGCLLAHLTVYIGLPLLWFSPGTVLAIYFMRGVISSLGMFAILAPAHFPAEAACLARDQRDAGDFYLRQTVTTVNFRTGPFGRLMCSGLENQIEHHLFPAISHVHYRQMGPLVEAFCVKRGMPYRRLGWGEVIWKSYLVFMRPKAVLRDVESLRRLPIQSAQERGEHNRQRTERRSQRSDRRMAG